MFNEDSLLNSQEQKEQNLKNTAEFRSALDEGRLSEAEKFLENIASHPEEFPQYDERWLDHRQRELFQSFYKVQDWRGAKRIVESTKDPRSREGRIARLEDLSDLKYEEI